MSPDTDLEDNHRSRSEKLLIFWWCWQWPSQLDEIDLALAKKPSSPKTHEEVKRRSKARGHAVRNMVLATKHHRAMSRAVLAERRPKTLAPPAKIDSAAVPA